MNINRPSATVISKPTPTIRELSRPPQPNRPWKDRLSTLLARSRLFSPLEVLLRRHWLKASHPVLYPNTLTATLVFCEDGQQRSTRCLFTQVLRPRPVLSGHERNTEVALRCAMYVSCGCARTPSSATWLAFSEIFSPDAPIRPTVMLDARLVYWYFSE